MPRSRRLTEEDIRLLADRWLAGRMREHEIWKRRIAQDGPLPTGGWAEQERRECIADLKEFILRGQVMAFRFAGFTQKEIGRTLGISQPTVSRYLHQDEQRRRGRGPDPSRRWTHFREVIPDAARDRAEHGNDCNQALWQDPLVWYLRNKERWWEDEIVSLADQLEATRLQEEQAQKNAS